MHGVHRYTHGVNIRAFVAFICGIAPDLPGLAAACGAKGIPKGASYLYSLSWLVAIVISGLVYWLLSQVFPMEISPTLEMYMDGADGTDATEEGTAEVEMNKKAFDLEL